MFSLFEGAQKKINNLLDYVATPEENSAANNNEQSEQEPIGGDESRQAEEVSINTSAIAGKVLSYAKIASNAAQQKANKLTNLVSQTAVFDNLNKQQEQFKESLKGQKGDDVPLPWQDLANEEEAKKRFLELSQNSNVFLEDAPVEMKGDYGVLAKKLMEHDENLSKKRYELVPKKLSEEKFWHNYLYRVSLLAKLLHENADELNNSAEEPQSSSTSEIKEEVVEKEQTNETSNNTDAKNKDKYSTPDKNSPSEIDEDWETELLSAELDMVNKETNDETWEDELDELLESCKTEDKPDEKDK